MRGAGCTALTRNMTAATTEAGWADEVQTVSTDLEYKGLSIITAIEARLPNDYTYMDISRDTGHPDATIRRWLKEEKLETYSESRLMRMRSWVADRDVRISDELEKFVNSTYVTHLANAEPIGVTEDGDLEYQVNTSMFPVLQAVGRMADYRVNQTGVSGVPVWVRQVDPGFAPDL